jgi:FkbM family methyltransferase
MKLWCRLARSATGILDIGANVGVYSLAAASLRKDIAVHAFEPNPHAYTRLRMHKLLNHYHNIAEHTFAVGDRNEYVNFSWTIKPFPQISSGGKVSSNPGKGLESVIVPMRMLDGTGIAKTLGAKPLIKIDVEGGEAGTFRGMREVLALRPDIIVETFLQESCDTINPMISELGYNVFLILEAEGKVQQLPSLTPCKISGNVNYNQLVTTRSATEIATVLA